MEDVEDIDELIEGFFTRLSQLSLESGQSQAEFAETLDDVIERANTELGALDREDPDE